MSTHARSEVVPETLAGYRLDQALAQMFPEFSRSRLTEWLKRGDVTMDGVACKPRTRVAGGERIEVRAEQAPDPRIEPQDVGFEVAWQDDAVIVVNKPAGLVVHPGAGNADGTLQNGLLFRYPELAELPRAGLVHRIDKDTSGLLLVARTLTAHTALVRQLAEHEISREYRAICHGVLTGGGSVDAPIGRHPTDRLRMAVRDGGREAVTHYRLIERFAHHTLVQVMLETGRTHQVRVHFAHLRHPLVGDPVYGGRRRRPPGNDTLLIAALEAFQRQALHAARLEFAQPETGETVSVHADDPDDFANLVEALRSHAIREAS
ncbi:MAG: 23S rRNA pseudouridine(1911/1915/1917) synthase RluD [Pseudomonadota bacterium]